MSTFIAPTEGITSLTAAELAEKIHSRELTSREAADQIAEQTHSDVVQVIGSRFVLFKRNPQDPVIDLKAVK